MTYFAFLKGINISGHRIIKMAELKAIFEAMGHKNVRTFIQSGNVVFESPAKADVLKKTIESGLKKSFAYDVKVVIRTKAEMEKIIKEYPFSKVKGNEECKITVGYLESEPGKDLIKELETFNTDNEIFVIKGNNLYHLVRGNFSDSIFFKKNIVEKTLKIVCTARNWNTTNKILNI
ncbi:MAG: DUF1697 domain-containing protein [Ignavibacteria bacterium]